MLVDVNGIQLYATDTGGKVPLICVHGGMGIDGNTLRVASILALADQDVRVIVPDLRGQGRSIAHDAREFTHARWADDLRELAIQLKLGRFAMLGHSYGGFLALEFASRWPEMLTHLVLVGTSAGPRHAPTDTFSSDEALKAHFRARWPGFFHGSDKHWRLFDDLQFSASAYNAAFERELPRYDLRDRVPAITTPTLLVCGSHDWYRQDMEWLAGHLPAASLAIVQDAGHLVFLERPEEFTRLVGTFLARPSGQPSRVPSPEGRVPRP
jgi:proline iminopeptidase